MSTEHALKRALGIDPEGVREAAADARALAIEDLVGRLGASETARRLGVSPSAVTKARARVREIDPDRRRAAEILAGQLGF